MKINRFISFKLTINKLIKILLVLFYSVCIFDPAGLFLGIKVPLFVFLLFLSFFSLLNKRKIEISRNVLYYILFYTFVIPLLSLLTVIMFRFGTNNTIPLIFNAFKTNSFLLIILVFYSIGEVRMKSLVKVLSLLSIVIIVLHYYVTHDYFRQIYDFGKQYKIYGVAKGEFLGIDVVRMYFWTSPMLVLSIAYFSHEVIMKRSLLKNIIFLGLNVIGMLYSGSRLNMSVALVTFFIIYFFYSKRKMLIILLILLVTFFNIGRIKSMLGNSSDKAKLGMVDNYFEIYFSDAKTLFFGQGLGSEVYIKERGRVMSYTELTYFELFRKYGVVFGIMIVSLMIFPLLFYNRVKDEDKWLLVTYLLFLFMVSFNPFYFSSNGMIVLSIVLFLISDSKGQKKIVLRLDRNINKLTE